MSRLVWRRLGALSLDLSLAFPAQAWGDPTTCDSIIGTFGRGRCRTLASSVHRWRARVKGNPVAAKRRKSRPVRMTLSDGQTTAVREVTPADVGALECFINGLSAASLRHRFFGDHVDAASAARPLAGIAERGGVGLIAIQEQAILGHIHLARTGEGLPEMSIAVADAVQGKGLGKALIHRLRPVALDVGWTRYTARVLMTNQRMLRLLRSEGCAVTASDQPGVVNLVIGLTGPPAWPADEARPRVLVESDSFFGDVMDESIRALGYAALRCPRLGRPCPMVTSGRCSLAESADLIVVSSRLEEDQLPVLKAHHRLHPETPVCTVTGRVGPDGWPSRLQRRRLLPGPLSDFPAFADGIRGALNERFSARPSG